MSEEIKLGWYRSRIVESEHEEVVYATSTQVVIRSTGYMFIWSANSIRDHYEYIGTELPTGEWVDIDLAKVTLADLPIQNARFRDHENGPWFELTLTGYSDLKSADLKFETNSGWYRFCQVWRPL